MPFEIFPGSTRYTDWGILLLRIITGVVFFASGWGHVKSPTERAKSLGLSVGFTIFLGGGELLGGLGIIFGVLTQLAALGMILIMLGAIYMKTAKWHTGFWGEKSSGWHYDLMLLLMCLVILLTDGGRFTLMNAFAH